MSTNKKKQLFSEIYNENSDSILRLCYMYLKDKELAQDATQETFLKAYRKFYSFKELSSINTWLTSIAINTCKNIIRKSNYKEKDISLEEVEYQLSYAMSDNDKTLAVSDAVTSLPQDYREIILLRYYRDLPIKDIAKLLSLPQTTVNYRLLKAKSLLKDILKEDFFDE
ncbi:MAG: sigma-70 family RNA polymerase sigma factor [Ruminococcus sp.]|nr:sigma-70 family RNA polymerase sigma factor [Ruminococcus sp.]